MAINFNNDSAFNLKPISTEMDTELFLMFSSGFTAKFEFKGSVDIGAIGRLISSYCLK